MSFNLKKIVGFLLLIHAGYSLMRYRKYLTFKNRMEDFSIPFDVKCFNFIKILLFSIKIFFFFINVT